jgi:hypothetical protein
MKKYVIMTIVALVVSAATVVAVRAYKYYSMPPLMRANLEALSQNENPLVKRICYNYVVLATLNDPYFVPIRKCDECSNIVYAISVDIPSECFSVK